MLRDPNAEQSTQNKSPNQLSEIPQNKPRSWNNQKTCCARNATWVFVGIFMLVGFTIIGAIMIVNNSVELLGLVGTGQLAGLIIALVPACCGAQGCCCKTGDGQASVQTTNNIYHAYPTLYEYPQQANNTGGQPSNAIYPQLPPKSVYEQRPPTYQNRPTDAEWGKWTELQRKNYEADYGPRRP
jgi:hypothetical protein